MELPADMPLPTAEQLAAVNAELGTIEPRPGYVLHRHVLAAHRRDRAAARRRERMYTGTPPIVWIEPEGCDAG